MILGLIAQLISFINEYFRKKKCLILEDTIVETFEHKDKKYDKEKYITLRKESYLSLKPRQLRDELEYFDGLAKKGKMDGYNEAMLRAVIKAYNAKPSTEKIDEEEYISKIPQIAYADASAEICKK